ncbi:Cytosol aminopeptidase [Papilio machaon]|uniref:Cytosol aminopeptidase n=1 Tax=Papilio machaon TaxID=76193 RepID=A0A194RF30_PAPMA|nr:Cytosol aminopeptidase [Papilio machaon]
MRLSKLFLSAFFRRITYSKTTVRWASGKPAAEHAQTCGSDKVKVKEVKSNENEKKGVVVGVFDNGKELELTCAGREIDQRSGGKLARQLNEVSCQLKLGHALVVTDVGEEGDVALACCGLKHAGYNKLEELDEKRENVRWGIGAGVRALQARGCARVLVDSSVAPDAAAEAAHLAAWSYNGASSDTPPVLLAAKGVTFDSGGLCLKPPEHMRENRGSMSGAAVVLAAIKAIAELKIPINIRAVIPLCENLVSGQCMKVGDVVRALNGTSIQIEDTDMEGRLLLADALVYGQAAYRPALVVDVATLTRGVLLATGGGAFGCFSNAEGAWLALRGAGASSGDRPWRFPLWNYYHAQITGMTLYIPIILKFHNDPSVDLRNKGSGKATPCIGAAFLRNFVCGEWVHLDVTGVGKLAHAAAPPYLRRRRMSGRPARTLAYFLAQLPNYAAKNSRQH